MYKFYQFLLIIPVILSLGSVFGQGALELVEKELAALSGPGKQVGFQLMDIESGEVIFGWNDNLPLIPASIQKCITAFSVLHYLGEDYIYKTPISYTGFLLRDGNLTGDLLIEGSGDPSTGSSKHINIKGPDQFFNAIANRISKAGIKCIDGDLIIDVSEFGRAVVPRKWFWEDLGNYYGAGVWGINYNENKYDIYLSRTNVIGAPVQIDHIEPLIPGLFHHSMVRTAERGTGDQAYIFGAPNTYERTIEGTIPRGNDLFSIRGSMPNPPRYFGDELAKALFREDINFRSVVIQYDHTSHDDKIRINSLQSPKLIELVKSMLEDSNNMYAEAFVKKIGNGSHELGLDRIAAYLLESGVQMEGLKTIDGSGLSVLNQISAKQINSFLRAQCSEFGIKKIENWLPLAGKEGTVASMLTDDPAKGHVWIKSGSMDGVLCYHGIINTAFRQNYAFTIMINGDIRSRRKARERIESLLNLVYQKPL